MGTGTNLREYINLGPKINSKQETGVTHLNLLPEGAQAGLDAAATGQKYAGASKLVCDPEFLGNGDKVYIESSLLGSAAGIEVTVEIYDNNTGAVADSFVWTDLLTAAPTRNRSADIAGSLTSGNEVYVRFNVTTAVSGATFDVNAARLVVVSG